MLSIGDKVKVVNDQYIWLTRNGLGSETILTIVEQNDNSDSYVDSAALTIEIEVIKDWPNDFQKVSDSYFQGGIVSNANLGNVGETVGVSLPFKGFHLGAVCNDPEPTVEKIIPMELGVYRPNLEDRKVGKVQMHMVDDGFPNALREVAKVMTWAADAKGYKLHDWKNLPQADVAFPSAGYRHRNDNSIQKALGLSASERVDHESALLHKAHEAFNVLAELELILTGAIK